MIWDMPPVSTHLECSNPAHFLQPPTAGAAERKNIGKRHEDGIGHISANLKDLAREANILDEDLHEFVSAKFCRSLLDASLLNHVLVRNELALNERLSMRYEQL